MKLPYNIHASINMKSHRKGLVNDASLLQHTKEATSKLGVNLSFQSFRASQYPANTYPVYYPKVCGRGNSLYPLK